MSLLYAAELNIIQLNRVWIMVNYVVKNLITGTTYIAKMGGRLSLWWRSEAKFTKTLKNSFQNNCIQYSIYECNFILQ